MTSLSKFNKNSIETPKQFELYHFQNTKLQLSDLQTNQSVIIINQTFISAITYLKCVTRSDEMKSNMQIEIKIYKNHTENIFMGFFVFLR